LNGYSLKEIKIPNDKKKILYPCHFLPILFPMVLGTTCSYIILVFCTVASPLEYKLQENMVWALYIPASQLSKVPEVK
jgi:hypothetical protein